MVEYVFQLKKEKTMKTNNKWLESNKPIVDSIIRQAITYDAKGSYGGVISFKWIIKLLQESSHEIFRLQSKVDLLEKQLIKDGGKPTEKMEPPKQWPKPKEEPLEDKPKTDGIEI